MVSPDEAANRLSANLGVFKALLEGITPSQARWRPAPDKWSMLEVVCHLADEEREDFRTRLDYTLNRAGEPWPPIDPEGWVVEREYSRRDLAAALDDFAVERARSVHWLRGLVGFDPDVSYDIRASDRLTAGDLLLSWLAHDLIHIRQITRLHYQFLAAEGGPYSPAYAGKW